MDHFVKEIYIEKLRHLSNIHIKLDENLRQHLLLTGKNGSGKTTLLLAIKKYLQRISEGLFELSESEGILQLGGVTSRFLMPEKTGVEILFREKEGIEARFKEGEFIIAFFGADRKVQIDAVQGVENVVLKKSYDIDEEPTDILLKYMVHLKTQQSYARNEDNTKLVELIGRWFERFENALKLLLDNESIRLEFDHREYDFKILEEGREPYGFTQLSDGYSSVIRIVSDLIMRMDQNWLLRDELSTYDAEGIVLIDELETHLHIELQRRILPFLTTFFPRIQFIVSTHSPFILNSISNARIYDLEKHVTLENMSVYSSEGIVEGYFGSDGYSEMLKNKLKKYEELVKKDDVTEEERAERAKLRIELKGIPQNLAAEARDAFEEIEARRKTNDSI